MSPRGRAASLERMKRDSFDVLVVGGGVVGAGIAWDATMRGLKTALVERGDFASGTSGKTSRLIHGGLRYLRDFRLGLVRQAVRERDHLLRHAPGLVKPLRFTIPIYWGKPPGQVSLRLGLWLYDRLSGGETLPKRAWRASDEALRDEPRLRKERILGAGRYYDAVADDARLVLAIVQAASRSGAAVANYAEAVSLVRENGEVVGARIRDHIAGEAFALSASKVVNATGVWLDGLRTLEGRSTTRPTKGIHVFVPRDRLENREAVALSAARDGRMIFVLPWGRLALLGTTDTDFEGDLNHPLPEADEVVYLLESANAAFPGANLGIEDVVSAYAGLRPLVRGKKTVTKESDISRAHEIIEDDDGLISVAGGKLTTFRAMAEQVVDRVCDRIGRTAPCRTRNARLGPPPDAPASFEEMGFEKKTAEYLRFRHSVDELRPWIAEPSGRRPIVDSHPWVWGEVDVALEDEMAMHLEDVMVRRLPLFYETRDQGLSVALAVASRMAAGLGWAEGRIREEVDAYHDLVAAHRRFHTSNGR